MHTQVDANLTRDHLARLLAEENSALTEFEALLDSVEVNLKQMASRIFAGAVEVDPYRRGSMTACEHCDYASICRIDPWTHAFRSLKKPEE